MFRRHLSLALCVVAVATVGAQSDVKEQNKEQERLVTAGAVMSEILSVADNVPREVLDKAECVVVIPSMTRVAVGVGASYGRGAMVCRSGTSFNGPWGAPAMYAIDAGSIGLQIGLESIDLILMVMNRRGVDALLGTTVKLGAEASAAAGPKGRHVEASTDASMRGRNPQLLAFARPVCRHLGRWRVAAPRQRRHRRGVRTQDERARDRHRCGEGPGVRPSAGGRAAEVRAVQPIRRAAMRGTIRTLMAVGLVAAAAIPPRLPWRS